MTRTAALLFAFAAGGCVATPRSGEPEPLDFALARLGGGEYRLSHDRGRPVLLHLFATWCEPCKTALPSDAALARSLAGEGLAAYAVSVDADTRDVAAFVEPLGLGIPVLLDPEVNVADRQLHMKALPATFLFDATGRLRHRHEGEADVAERIRAEAEALLVEAKGARR